MILRVKNIFVVISATLMFCKHWGSGAMPDIAPPNARALVPAWLRPPWDGAKLRSGGRALHIRRRLHADRDDGRRLQSRVSQPSLRLEPFSCGDGPGASARPLAIVEDGFRWNNPGSASQRFSLCTRVGGSRLTSSLNQLDPFLKEKKKNLLNLH